MIPDPSSFFRLTTGAWKDITALVPEGTVWPRSLVVEDLRWWADQVRMGREALPGRRALATRWGWTERTTRTILRELDPLEQGRPTSVPLASHRRPTGVPPASHESTDSEGSAVADVPLASHWRPTSVPPASHRRPTGVPQASTRAEYRHTDEQTNRRTDREGVVFADRSPARADLPRKASSPTTARRLGHAREALRLAPRMQAYPTP